MIKNKKIIAIVIVAIVGTIVFWKRDYIKQKLGLSDKEEKNDINQNNQQKDNTRNIIYKECNHFPLKLGCKGTKIKGIQIALNRYYSANLQVDGYFGPITQAALETAGFGKTLEITEVTRLLNK